MKSSSRISFLWVRSATGTDDGRAARHKLERVAALVSHTLLVWLLTARVGGVVGRGSSGLGTLLKMVLQKSMFKKTLDARRMLAYGLEFRKFKRRLNVIKHFCFLFL
jgi:hypothetical protein